MRHTASVLAYLQSDKGQDVRRPIPLGRFGEAGDLDGALLLLVSKAGAYMTGASVIVDGGQLVAPADPSALRMRPLHSIGLL